VYSGSLDAVKVIVKAGADLERKDTIYEGTALGWAEYGRHVEIAEFLRGKGAR
jgi:peptide-methionine (S)-S-oxide reductase